MKLFKRTSTRRTGEEGFGLLFGLFAMAVIGVIGWSMVTSGLVDMTISDNYRSRSTAFYAADAGLEQTVIDMKLDDSWVSSLIDTSDWTAVDPAPSSFTINGNAVSTTLDGGAIEPGYYPIGDPATLGDGTYVREIYLPLTITPLGGDEDEGDDEGSGGSSSGASEDSGSSGSRDSGSDDSGSGGSGNSSDPGSNDSGSDGLLASVGHSLAAMLAPRRLLLVSAPRDDDSGSGDSGSGDDGAEKVTLCHIPPGNPSAEHTITVGAPAWPAHEAHGDHLGPCEGDADSEDDSGSGDDCGSGSGACNDDEGSSEPDATVTVSLRSTGTGGDAETATQVLRADLEIDLRDDGTIADIRVRNWVQER